MALPILASLPITFRDKIATELDRKQRGKRAIVESDITGNTLRVSNFNNTTPRECC
jgi:hypothetical protein